MILPFPPSESEKYLYVNSNKNRLYVFGIFSSLLLIIGMFLFSLSDPSLYWFILIAIVYSAYLLLSLVVIVFGGGFSLKEHIFTINSTSIWPVIDVYLPSCGEPLEVLENTYKHVKNLDYPGGLAIYILDDSKNESHCFQVRRLAKKYGFNYISRENKGYLKKSGNVRNAFRQTSGEFILILDADFCPRSDFLRETVPYMVKDNQIGILQTPQFFSVLPGMTWVEKGAGYTQELFYRLIQPARNKWGASICVGTSALYHRKALLPFGGTAKVEYSEDAFTGLQTISSGYSIKYVPINLSKGMCPDNQNAYITQLYRWCMGSISMMTQKRFWLAPIRPMAKLCYLTGQLYFLTTGLSIYLAFVPSIIMTIFFPDKILLFNAVFSLPSMAYGMVLVPLWTKAPWGLYALKIRTLANFAHFLAIVDKGRGGHMPWIPTGQVRKKDLIFKRYTFHLSATIIISIVYFALVAWRSTEYPIVNFVPSLIFNSINLAVLLSLYAHQKELAVPQQ